MVAEFFVVMEKVVEKKVSLEKMQVVEKKRFL